MDNVVRIPVAVGVTLIKNVMIPMRDGVRIAADLYCPEPMKEGDRFPVVMEYIPYRKDEADVSRHVHYAYLPQHGYVVARVDIRGTGASEGVWTDEYTLEEQLDGYDAIEWLANQRWCDGHVNMMGISYGGFTALQVASHNPPHLTSIIPVDFTDDRYIDECHYRGGLARKYYNVGYYGGFMIAWNAMPPYPEWSGEDWARVWEHHLEHNEPGLFKWYRNQTDGPFWRLGSVRDYPERIRCPAFLIGGWRDGYPNPPLRLFRSINANANNSGATPAPCKVLIGPWNHAMPDAAIPGPRIDYLHEVVRWLDYWCKGINTGVMDEPPVVVYMQHAEPPLTERDRSTLADRLETTGEWRSEKAWPPPGAAEKTLYLGAENRLQEEPAVEGVDSFTYDPTVGTTGGLWSGGIQFGLPGDQRPDEALSLVYTTPPLHEQVQILGWPRAVLHLASTASVIGFAVSLCDVAPDGTSQLVAKGMLNATRRASFTNPSPLIPGEATEIEIEIDCTGWGFDPGHRIRLSIASADWPNVWPTPEPATNHGYRGPGRASRLVLPLVPAQGSAPAPQFRPSTRVVQHHSDAAVPPTWEITREMLTGRTTAKVHAGQTWRINERTVAERESGTTCQVDPRDPAHASARGWHLYRILRPNQVTQARSEVVSQATASHFHITIDLEVRIHEAPHLTRRWTETIARQLL